MACKWVLTWEDDCNTVLYSGLAEALTELEEDTIDFKPTQAETITESIQDGQGVESIVYSKTRSRYRTSWVLTNDEIEVLQYIKMYQVIKLNNTFDSVEYDIDPASIEFEILGSELDYQREVVMSFSLVDSWAYGNACCDSAYDNSPYGSNTVPGGSGEIDPNEPSGCLGYSASIDETNLPVLGITESSIPANSTSVIEWYHDGNYKGNGSTLQVGEYGVYSFIIRRSITGETISCNRTDAFVYLNECLLYDIQVKVTNGTITADVVGVPNDDSGSFEVIDDLNVVVSNSLPYTPTDDGTYTVKYTSARCGDIMKAVIVILPIESQASHTVDLQHQNGGLFADVINAPIGAQTFVWTKIDINGNEVQVYSGSDTYQPTSTALYKVTVTIDGNSSSDQKLWIAEGLEVKIVNTAEEPVVTSEVSSREPLVVTLDGTSGISRYDFSAQNRELPHPSIYNTDEAMRTKIMISFDNVLCVYEGANYNGNDMSYGTPSAPLKFGIDKLTEEIVFYESQTADVKIVIIVF